MTDRPLSIAMMTSLYRPAVSGSSTQSERLASELARRGHRTCVVTAKLDDDLPDVETRDGVTVHRLPCLRLPKLPIAMNFPWLNWTFTPCNLRRIAAILRHHRPDVLHLHNHMFDMSFAAVRMRQTFNLPLLITIHTIIQHSSRLYDLALAPADRLLIRSLVADRADLLIGPDANYLDYARRAFPRTASALLPYGIELPPRPDEQTVEDLRRRYDLAGREVIVSLGNVLPVRDRSHEVRALPELLKRLPKAVLLIVGAENLDTPRRLAEQLNVAHAVRFTGPIAHDLVPAHLALGDVEIHLFTQDAPERTSLGIASLEAMSAGKCVLASANADCYGPGLLRDGENFCQAPRNDPRALAVMLAELLEAPSRARRIGRQAARTLAEHFGWDAICRRTVETYRHARRLRTMQATSTGTSP